jgi:hypothetical protein
VANAWRVLALAGIIGGTGSAAPAEEPPIVEITIKDHRFQPSELRVPAGTPLVIRIRNLNPTAEELESPSLKLEKVIAGGGTGTVRIRGLNPGRHDFIGEYYSDTAKGVLIAE